jgi:hypothetical protein
LAAATNPRRVRRPVAVGIRFKSNRRVFSKAVIPPADKDDEPYRVLSWHHDIGELHEMRGLLEPASSRSTESRGRCPRRSSRSGLHVWRGFLHHHEV